jgi:plasmid stabilization system protein ParE
MTFTVRLTESADEDLAQLYDFLAEHSPDITDRALSMIESSFTMLAQFPWSCRKAVQGDLGPRYREHIISFGAAGYVALFEIENDTTVTVLAVRHQRESDFH